MSSRSPERGYVAARYFCVVYDVALSYFLLVRGEVLPTRSFGAGAVLAVGVLVVDAAHRLASVQVVPGETLVRMGSVAKFDGAQLLRGHVELVLPSRAALLQRLEAVRRDLEGTRFAVREHEDYVEATCPWGNRIRCHEPQERFGPVALGMPVVECAVPLGSADATARFYREIIGAPATTADRGGPHARIAAGLGQELVFRETDRPIRPYNGHHIHIYVAGFSGPHRRLLERGLVTEESDQHQYRFRDIVDPESGRLLFTLEHEVRSMRHPLSARPLVNRNPDLSTSRYAPGHEALAWSVASATGSGV